MHVSRRPRSSNLLGALALAVVDRLQQTNAHQEGHGLTATAALNHVRWRPGQNIHFLARLLDVSHPAAVRLVDRLEADGLVERRAMRDDARSRGLVLTRTGQRAAVAAARRRLAVVDEVLAPLSPAEQRRFELLLEKILRALPDGRWSARHICRLCDFPVCETPACPVDEGIAEPGLPLRASPVVR
jgi:MarR family transcriptional repressor of emrRAB